MFLCTVVRACDLFLCVIFSLIFRWQEWWRTERAQHITSCQGPGTTRWRVQKSWTAVRAVEDLKANRKQFTRLSSPNCCGRNTLYRMFISSNLTHSHLWKLSSSHSHVSSTLQRQRREHALLLLLSSDAQWARGGRPSHWQSSAAGPASDGGGSVGWS